MADQFQSFRQPMVTASGILLGFILNFAAVWTSNAFKTTRNKDLWIALSLGLCIPILIVVIYRILNINYPKGKSESYYKKTLILFIIALVIPFIAIMATMIESYLVNR